MVQGPKRSSFSVSVYSVLLLLLLSLVVFRCHGRHARSQYWTSFIPSTKYSSAPTVSRFVDSVIRRRFAMFEILGPPPQPLQTLTSLFQVPSGMQGMVRDKWFAGDKVLYDKFQHPRILIVTNRYTRYSFAKLLLSILPPQSYYCYFLLRKVIIVILRLVIFARTAFE